MLSFVTHHVFAATVQRISSDAIEHLAAQYPAAYYWGAQGAAPLRFYHAPLWSSVHSAADCLAQCPPLSLFEALCSAAARQHNAAALAYVLGYCTYYAISAQTQPFLKAQAARIVPLTPDYSPAARLRYVASSIDSAVINAFISDDDAHYAAYRLLQPAATEAPLISRVLSQAAYQCCALCLSPAVIYRSMHDMRRVYQLAHSGAYAQSRLYVIERLLGRAGMLSSLLPQTNRIDCCNQNHLSWQSAEGPSTDSFFDLFHTAVPHAVALQRTVLQRYYQQQPLDAALFAKGFDGKAVGLRR